MDTQLIKGRIGDQEVLIEVVRAPGSQELSGVRERAADLFERAGDVVDAAAKQAAGMVRRVRDQAEPPDEITIQMGLTLSTTGAIVVASSTATASLSVSMKFTSTSRNRGEA
ncbi:CU044_2847 family protein [Actinomyces procaprae]|uniref:CU044_2847 family protein n=1 Tax=Actinomyces procaprae TaxID=2560010 RepID=UPI00109DA649|nr:CU044_2847 family protein [Actinomyces procaprae]